MNFNSKKKAIYFISTIGFIASISQGIYDVPKAAATSETLLEVSDSNNADTTEPTITPKPTRELSVSVPLGCDDRVCADPIKPPSTSTEESPTPPTSTEPTSTEPTSTPTTTVPTEPPLVTKKVIGGVNAHANNTCVNEIGDTARVNYMVQHQPLITSSNHTRTSGDGVIAIPKNLKNLKISIKAIGIPESSKFEDKFIKFDNFNVPIKNVGEDIKTIVDDKYGSYELLGAPYFNNSSFEDTKISSIDELSKKIKDDNKDFFIRKVSYEQAVDEEDENYSYYINNFIKYSYDEYPADEQWYGDHNDEYDYYLFGNTTIPMTFDISGDVEVSNKDTFMPIAVTNIRWRKSMELQTGSYTEGALDLGEYDWGKLGALPPVAPTEKEIIEKYKKNNTNDGLDVSTRIAPTKEIEGEDRYYIIGSDIRESSRGYVDDNYRKTPAFYNDYNIQDAENSNYGQVMGISHEDGADLAASHITICEDKPTNSETPTNSKTPTNETPTNSKTPTNETPTNSNEPSSKTPSNDTPIVKEPINTTINKIQTITTTKNNTPITQTRVINPNNIPQTKTIVNDLPSDSIISDMGLKADTGGKISVSIINKIRTIF